MVPLNSPAAILCQQFRCNAVVFNLPAQSRPDSTASQSVNAFAVLMKNSTVLHSVSKIKTTTAKDKLYNDIIDLLYSFGVQFASSNVHSFGKLFVRNLCDLLWHITCNHDYFSARGSPIPEIFQPFKDLNDYYI